MNVFYNLYIEVIQKDSTLEYVQDMIRSILHNIDSNQFPITGNRGTSIEEVWLEMFNYHNPYHNINTICEECGDKFISGAKLL